MLGEVMVRPGFGEKPDFTRPFYCEDWRCPAKGECEHHFGRSYAYAAMVVWWDGKDRTPFHTPERPPYAPQCEHFRRDKPREWLQGYCEPFDKSWCCTGCEAPECPRANNVIQLFGGAHPA